MGTILTSKQRTVERQAATGMCTQEKFISNESEFWEKEIRLLAELQAWVRAESQVVLVPVEQRIVGRVAV